MRILPRAKLQMEDEKNDEEGMIEEPFPNHWNVEELRNQENGPISDFELATLFDDEEFESTKMYRKIATLPKDMNAIVKTMTCAICGRIPSPYYRYLCSESHLLCYYCGQDQIIKHQSKCFAKADLITYKEDTESEEEVPEALDETSAAPSSSQSSPKRSSSSEVVYGLLCQQKISLYQADHIYASIWKNLSWMCPNLKYGCNTRVKGYDLFEHLESCKKKEQAVKCIVPGCRIQASGQDMEKHFIVDHNAYGVDISMNLRRGMNCHGLLNVPILNILDGVPFYAVVRCFERFFLFSMEPIIQEDHFRFCVRTLEKVKKKRASKKENNQHFLSYALLLVSRKGSLKVSFEGKCMPWDWDSSSQSTQEIAKSTCMTLPVSMVLSQCIDTIAFDSWRNSCDCEAVSKHGYLPVNLTIQDEELEDSSSDSTENIED